MNFRRDDGRTGYTLIEMIIASVLVGALMAVAFSLLSMYSKFLTAGQSVASEQQLLRSVLQLVEADLQSVALPDGSARVTFQTGTMESMSASMMPELADAPGEIDPFGSMDSIQSASLTEEPSILADLAGAATNAVPARIVLTGNSRVLRLSIQSHAPDMSAIDVSNAGATTESDSPDPLSIMEETSVEGKTPKVPEFQSIIWQFQPLGMTGGTQQLQSGLYRVQADSLELQTALQQKETLLEPPAGSSDSLSVDQTTLETLLYVSDESQTEEANGSLDPTTMPESRPSFDLIPEVVGCRFQYFDGTKWESSWNSDQKKELPVAIRIRLKLATPENLEKLARLTGSGDTEDSTLDEAIDAGQPKRDDAAASEVKGSNDSANPQETIPTRDVDRIIMLQPISGPLPLIEKLDDGPNGSFEQQLPLQADSL